MLLFQGKQNPNQYANVVRDLDEIEVHYDVKVCAYVL